jgi:aminopeptidase N
MKISILKENFLKGLKAYFDKHAWKNTELSDLLTELSISSGRDLDSWTKLWLQSSGATLLRPQIQTDANNVITNATIQQEPPSSPPGLPPVLRPHRLVVGTYEKQGTKLIRTNRFEIDVELLKSVSVQSEPAEPFNRFSGFVCEGAVPDCSTNTLAY